MALSTLTFVDARRPAGKGQVQRDYLDLVVDSVSLREVFGVGDQVSVLGWLASEHEGRMVRALLGMENTELSPGRVPLYVCPECADISCIALTVHVARRGGEFVWSDFGHEGPIPGVDLITPARTFRFDEVSYRNAFARFPWRRGGKRGH